MTTLASRIGALFQSLFRTGDDALAAYRSRIALQLSLLAVVILLPFTISHLLGGHLVLAGLIAIAQAVVLVNGRALQAEREAPVPLWVMVLALVGAVTSSIWVQGAQGSLWAYPILFITYFLVRRRVALLLSLLLVASATFASAVSVGDALAVRMLATLSLTLLMINVVLNVVGDLQAALVAQTITDPLTGAYNRRHLDTQLAALPRPLPLPLPGSDGVNMLMALDIDHFKQINDTHGHAVGDEVLRGLVATLQLRLRASDRLFRTGGEEFVLLLPRISAADAARLAEELRHRVSQAPLSPAGPITVSIGVAAQRPGLDAAAWMRVADEALYEAKRSGRNRVVMVD